MKKHLPLSVKAFYAFIQRNLFIRRAASLLICLTCGLFSNSIAQSTFTGATDNTFNTASNWSPSGVPSGGTAIIIPSGKTCNMISGNSYTGSGAITLAGTLSIPSGATFTPTGVLTMASGSTLSGGGSVTLSTFTINTTLTTDKATITNSSATVPINIKDGGTINFTKGLLKLTGQTLGSIKALTINVTSSGNIANSTDGGGDTDADGGTVSFGGSSSATVTISGGALIFYNTIFTNGNMTLALGTTGNCHFNGTFLVPTTASSANQFKVTGNSPIWGANSTLYLYGGGQWNYSNISPLWNASGGTIGTTAGYPNNVTLVYNNNNSGAISQNIAINGLLTIGDGTNASLLSFPTGTAGAFSCGGFVMNANSTVTMPSANITIKGRFIINGGTFTNNSGTITLAGNGTCLAPDSIKLATGTFYNLTISNTAYTKLYTAATVSNILTLPSSGTSGIIETNVTNILSVTNTSTSSVTGGGVSSFINGPMKRTLLSSGTNSYIFPVGVFSCPSTNTYMPLTLSSTNTTASNVATVQAFMGSPGGSGLASGSTTEYWSLITSSGLGATTSAVSVTRPSAIAAGSVIGYSATQTGAYTSIGGTVSGTGPANVNGSNNIGAASPWFFVIGAIASPTVTIATSGIQSAGSPLINTSKNVLYSFTASPTVADALLTGFNFTTTGSIVSTDITQYQLWYNPGTNNIANGATVVIGTVSGIGNATATAFGSFVSKTIVNGTVGYFWITADIASGATAGHTITVSALNAAGSNFTIAAANYAAGTITAGGLQTITATAPTVLTGAASAVTTTTATLNGTVNANLLSPVTANFDWGTSTSPYNNIAVPPSTGGTPSGNSPATTTLAITGLVSNTLYNFRTNGVYASATTNGANVTFITPPNAPTAVTANTPTTSGFTVSWTAPSNIGGVLGTAYKYNVYISTDNITYTLAAGGSNISTNTASVTGLTSNTVYYYEVQTVSTLAGAQTSAFDKSTTENNPTTITTIAVPIIPGTACTTGSGASATPAIIADGTPSSYLDAIWNNSPANLINQVTASGGTVQTGSSWKAMFDATNLYVLLTLNDKNKNENCPGDYTWDGADIYLNGDNTHSTFGSNISGQNTYGRGCSGTNTAPTNGGGTKSNSTYSTVLDGTGSYQEYITIPWANVPSAQHLSGGVITALSTIGFDVDYNDNQSSPSVSGRTNQQAWYTSNSNLYNTPSAWGYAQLSVCAPPSLSIASTPSINATSVTFIDTVLALNGGGSLQSNGAGFQYSLVSALTAPTFAAYSGTPGINPTAYSVVATGLSPQTKYYYQGYAARTNFGQIVNGVSVTNNFYTLSALPTTRPSTFTADCPQVTLSWSAVSGLPTSSQASRIGYIILRSKDPITPSLSTTSNRFAPYSALFNASLPIGVTVIDSISYLNGSLPPGTLTFHDTVSVEGTYNYELVAYTYDGVPADSTYNYFISGAKFASSTVTKAATWVGKNSNWNDPTNWCSGSVPTASTNAIIPGGLANYPFLGTVGSSTNGYVDSLSIASSASLTVGTGGSLSISGNITNTGGTFIASSGTIVTAGSSAQTITGSSFNNQTVYSLMDSTTSGGLSIDSINIIGELGFPYAGTSSLAISKNLVLISNVNTTAWVGPIAESGGIAKATITGNVIVQRYFPAHRRWRLIAAPVTAASAQTINAAWQEGVVSTTTPSFANPDPLPGFGTHITGPSHTTYAPGLGYDQSPANSASIAYVADTAAWYALPNTNVTKVTAHQGYMLFVRGSRNYSISTTAQTTLATAATLRTTGSLNTGLQNIPVSSGPNVIGNPYATTINFNSIYARNSAVLGSNTFYLWSPDIASASNVASGTGGWVVLTTDGAGGYTAVPTPINSFNTNGDIQSGAAFVVHAQTSGTVKIDEADKVSPAATNNDLYLFRPTAPSVPFTSLRTTLYGTAADTISYVADGVLNMFDNSFSNDVNWNKDIQKQANLNEQCAIIKNGRLISIQKSLPVNAGDTIYLQMARLGLKSYRFALQASNFNRPDLAAYLIDTFAHTNTPVSLSGNAVTDIDFTITSAAGTGAGRFAIAFRAASGSATYTAITAVQQNKDAVVQWTVSNQLNVKEYIVYKSTDGNNFYPVDTTLATSGSAANFVYNWVDTTPVPGANYYKVRNVNNDGAFGESGIAKLDISKEPVIAGITIYPNPVVNGIIGLQLNNMPVGDYNVSVINAAGQVVLTQTINHETTTENRNIILNKSAAKGVYILDVQSPSTQTKIKFVNQ